MLKRNRSVAVLLSDGFKTFAAMSSSDIVNAPVNRYFIVNKPPGMLSQFISGDMVGLDNLNYSFPEGIHAIGRLDKATEGLLILTTDKRITKLLFQSKVPHKRTYLVKVRAPLTADLIDALRQGVPIPVENKAMYITAPCEADAIEMPANLFKNPLEAQDYIECVWLQLSLVEGKYHQVRKMMTAIRKRCKRLVRVSIEDLTLGDLQPGEVREIPAQDFFELLKIPIPQPQVPTPTV